MSDITQDKAVEMVQQLLAAGSSEMPRTSISRFYSAPVLYSDIPANVQAKDGLLVVRWPAGSAHDIGKNMQQLFSDRNMPSGYEYSRNSLTLQLTPDTMEKLQEVVQSLKPSVKNIPLADLTHEDRVVRRSQEQGR